MKAERRSVGIHVGSASIVMIFAVLCLTVFSTLSFVTANHERKLAEKSTLAVQQYYAADCAMLADRRRDRAVGTVGRTDRTGRWRAVSHLCCRY